MKNAIIIFARHPELGKVKTRLASQIGDEAALHIYINLLQHTHDITQNLDCDKFVFYSDSIIHDDIWENEIYYKRTQSGHDLGERMQHAFEELFEKGYKKLVIIGSDCPGLSAVLIENAFTKLDTCSAVLGPAEDGGYYLMALIRMVESIFMNKKWSTNSVLADTISDLEKEGVLYSLLQTLWDVDTQEDMARFNLEFR